MKSLTVLLLTFFTSIAVLGQDIIIEGKVVDASSKTPLAYAHVGLKAERKGTITDLDGNFKLIVRDSARLDTIKVSMIGFSTYKIQVEKFIKSSTSTIELKNKVTTIKQVVITNENQKKQSALAKKLVTMAYQNILKNYPTRPYMLSGYFRTAYNENHEFVRMYEATFDQYDKGYHTNYRGIGNIVLDFKEVRKSNDYRTYQYKDEGEYIDLLIRSCDDIRNQSRIMDIELHKHYNFSISKITELDGKKIYVVECKPHELAYSRKVNSFSENYTPYVKLFIREGDYAITRIESDYQHLVSKWSSFGGVTDTTYSLNTQYYTTYEYKELDGKWYLQYKSYNREWEVFDNRSNKKFADYLIEEETIYNEIKPKAVVPRRIQEKILEYNFISPNNLYEKPYPYNESYWNQSNKNVKTRLYRDVKKDLQQHKPLNEQFRENNN
ncbi:MAG: carboxypeptidase-like regulatory domain-containing protein [Saprospiraceae bacterium]|nr:carboxypeptidase-like regulatory domain-containing protein [Saprospiraceae bacterium]